MIEEKDGFKMKRFASEMKSIIGMADDVNVKAHRDLEVEFMENAKPGDKVPKVIPHDDLWEQAVRIDMVSALDRIEALEQAAYRRIGFEGTMPLPAEAEATISNFEHMDPKEVTKLDVEALYSRYGDNRIARYRLSKLAQRVGYSSEQDPIDLQLNQIKQMSGVAKNAVWSSFYDATGIESPTDRKLSPEQACTIIDNISHGLVGFGAYLSDGSQWADDGQGAE